MVKEENNIG